MNRAELVQHLEQRYPCQHKTRRILLAAMPKSGSTYLSQFLSHLIDGIAGFGGQLPGRNEHELAPFWFWENQDKNLVAHMHTRYSAQTQVYLDHFRMQAVICVRSLADVIPSVIDHWRKHAISDGANWSFAHVHPHLMEQSDEALYEFAAVHVLPWYVNFYVSWARSGQGTIIAYDDIFAPDRAALIALAQSLGFDEARAQAAIASAENEPTRFNVGVSGRGRELQPSILEKIDHAVSFYPDVDWSPVWPVRAARQTANAAA